jgi:hypothetical protein
MPRKKNDADLLKKSDWIEYLTYLASKNQNLKIAFYSTVFAALAIIVAIIVSLPQIGINDNLSKGIVSIILSIYVIFIWIESFKFNYNINALIEKSADRLLSDIFSNEYPEFKNADRIKKKWEKIKQKINESDYKKRKEILKKQNKKVPDEFYFDKWFNDTP